MSLIDRYIYAVTRKLPVNQREDISDELKGMIEDQLDDKKSRSKKDIEEVLISLGDPDDLAYKYMGKKQYIIGPAIYPVFMRTLKLTFFIGIPIALVFQIISLLTMDSVSLINLLISSIGATIAIGIQMVFWVGLIFFILERTNVTSKDMRRYEEAWNPSMLPKIPHVKEVPASEAVTEIAFYATVALLPFISQFIGFHVDGRITPFFNPAIWPIATPVLVIVGLVGVVQGMLKLKFHQRSKFLAVFNLLFTAVVSAGLVAAYMNLTLVNPDFLTIFNQHAEDASLEQVTNWVNWTVGITIAVTVASYIYGAGKDIYLAFKTSKSR